MTLVGGVTGAVLGERALSALAAVTSPKGASLTPVFQDVSTAAGIRYAGDSWGCAWGDFNGDGLPDVWTPNHKSFESLWKNNGNGTFTDIASLVDPIPNRYYDTHGGSWADVDNRGVMDLLQVTDSGSYWPSPDFFLHNPGDGTAFVDQAAARNLQFSLSRSRMPLWFDFNNDGRLDLFEPNLRRGDGSDLPSAFFQQNPDGTFTDVTTTVNCNCSPTLQYGQIADIAGRHDGRPPILINGDLSVGFPQMVYDTTTVPFTDIRASLGIPIIPRVFDSVVADFTNSGRMDIFCVSGYADNDVFLQDSKTIHARLEPGFHETGFTFQTPGDVTFSLFPNFLVLKLTMQRVFIGAGGKHPTVANTSKPVFKLSSTDPTNAGIMPHTPGVDTGLYIGYDPGTATWTAEYSLGPAHTPAAHAELVRELKMAAGEGDGGQYLTFFVASPSAITNLQAINFTPNTGYPNVFLRNTTTGFVNQTVAAGLTGKSFGSVVAGDFDNDGYLDIFAVGSRGAGQLPNALWMNNGDGTFRLMPNQGGAVHTLVGHGDQVAVADYNRDGRLDLFVTNGRKPIPFFGPTQLFNNIANNGNHWIELHLVGTRSNRAGVGAHITLQCGTLTQQRDQDSGVHGRAQNWQDIHFGLGQNTVINSITINWPSGITQVLTNVAADQVMQVIEPAAFAGEVVEQDQYAVKQGPVTLPPWIGPAAS